VASKIFLSKVGKILLDSVLKCDILKIKKPSFLEKLGLSQGGNKMKRKMTSIIEACVVMALIALFATNALGQTKWTKYEGNPVLDLGAPGDWDDFHLSNPFVLFEDGIYKMWYSGTNAPNARIGYATSPDGITWTKYEDNPVLDLGAPGEWDNLQVTDPFVLFEDGTYKMWYTGRGDTSYHRIGYATSPDGITWTKYEDNPVLDLGAPGEWDDLLVGDPFVLFEDGTYKMWYSGQNGPNDRTGYATSPDGITWTRYAGNPVLNLGESGEWDDYHAYTPSVLFEDGTYKMWYSGHDGSYHRIGYTTSPDGIVWTKYEGNPVLDLGAPGAWDDVDIRDPFVLFDDGTYKMWYSGGNGDGSNWLIGYATSRATPGATIAIRTDKLTYHEGDSMTVYADVVNAGPDVPDALLVLHLVTIFRVFPVQIIPFEMPANYEVYNWEVFTIDSLPSLRRRSYAYLGVLASRSEGILAADIAFWTFSSSLSATEAARLRKVAEEYLWNLNVADLK